MLFSFEVFEVQSHSLIDSTLTPLLLHCLLDRGVWPAVNAVHLLSVCVEYEPQVLPTLECYLLGYLKQVRWY